ncbi:MAG: hypothetical protein HZB61_15880 [Nitrospirae bacterium]|nr:hypothetical protein [Nitrospirota bacterium]
MRKYIKITGVLLLFISLSSTFIACGSGGGGGSDSGTNSNSGDGNNDGGGDSNSVQTTIEASATIGASGGTVEVTDPSSPLHGVKVEIPAGALSTDTNISICIPEDEPNIPSYLKKVSAPVSLSPEGVLFTIPVTISFPYNSQIVTDINMLGGYTYDTVMASWDPVMLNDMGTGVITVMTWHFSTFVTAEFVETLPDSQEVKNYLPSNNGFSVKNSNQCHAMVDFALWYRKKNNGSLHNDYSECEARAIVQASQNYGRTIPRDKLKDMKNGKKWIANQLMEGIRNNQLQILAMNDINFNPASGHAVLVYKYKKNPDASITFYIYDPNYPYILGDQIYTKENADNRKIEYTKDGYFENYVYKNLTEYRLIYPIQEIYINDHFFKRISTLEMMPKVEIASPAPFGFITGNRLYNKIDLASNGSASGIFINDWGQHTFSSFGTQSVELTRATTPFISLTVIPGFKLDDSISIKEISSIDMFLDENSLNFKGIVPENSSRVSVSSTPDYDLNQGKHTVKLQAVDMEGITACPNEWDFYVEGECPNIAGDWNTTGTGTETQTIDGMTETKTSSWDVWAGLVVTFNQSACNISWKLPCCDSYRTGTIIGNNLQASGVWTLAFPNATYTENNQTFQGTLSYK